MTTAAADQTAASAGPKPMFTESQITKLRAAVIIMGVLLLLGFGVVIGRIVYLLNRPASPVAVTSQQTSPAVPNALAAAKETALRLPAGAVIRHLSLSGDRLAVHHEGPGGAGIVVIDATTGGVLQAIPIVTGDSR